MIRHVQTLMFFCTSVLRMFCDKTDNCLLIVTFSECEAN